MSRDEENIDKYVTLYVAVFTKSKSEQNPMKCVKGP
jgi:hypothetical protein